MDNSDKQNQNTPEPLSDWSVVSENEEFKDLMAAKARFIVPATACFVIYYFALPILVGYAPQFMATPVIGPVNIAYLFALSQFLVAWFIAYLYVRAANRFDEMGKSILAHLARHKAANEPAIELQKGPR
jgi:uncharacterized membrane protein (DUF485 family)